MLHRIMGWAAALSAGALLGACTDQQIREMATVGTYEDQPVYSITTQVRLPASDEKIRSRQAETLKIRAERLCPGGYREIARSREREIERLYDYPAYGGWGVWGWGWNRNTYVVLQQEIRIICTGPAPA